MSLKARVSQVIDWRILIFFGRLFGLLVGWALLYHYVLQPSHIPDRWLTEGIGRASRVVIQLVWNPQPPIETVYFSTEDQTAYLIQAGKRVFGIADVCNGLELMAIYTGLLLLLPGSTKRKWKYVIAGLIAVFGFNVIRAAALYHIYYHYYDYFLFNHKYVFTILMYLVIFLGWLLYTRKLNQRLS